MYKPTYLIVCGKSFHNNVNLTLVVFLSLSSENTHFILTSNGSFCRVHSIKEPCYIGDIWSDNGLLHDDTKPLPELMMSVCTYSFHLVDPSLTCYGLVCRHGGSLGPQVSPCICSCPGEYSVGAICSRTYLYDDVIMGAIASQIPSLTIVYSTVYSGAYQSKHQSSATLAFVWGIHRGPVNSPHKWPATRKMFPFDDVIVIAVQCTLDISRHLLSKELRKDSSFNKGLAFFLSYFVNIVLY